MAVTILFYTQLVNRAARLKSTGDGDVGEILTFE
jgi:hypothetical protein